MFEIMILCSVEEPDKEKPGDKHEEQNIRGDAPYCGPPAAAVSGSSGPAHPRSNVATECSAGEGGGRERDRARGGGEWEILRDVRLGLSEIGVPAAGWTFLQRHGDHRLRESPRRARADISEEWNGGLTAEMSMGGETEDEQTRRRSPGGRAGRQSCAHPVIRTCLPYLRVPSSLYLIYIHSQACFQAHVCPLACSHAVARPTSCSWTTMPSQTYSAFFYGTLLHPSILRRVIGHAGDELQICPALLLVSVLSRV